MTATLPPPFRLVLSMALLWFLQLVSIQNLYAQNNTTPTFNVDLTGDPNGQESVETARNGQLCGAANNENCIQFNVTLDRNAAGLEFEIASGPVPKGSMFYKIDCGDPVPVGAPICVVGTGPHVLTICMPGNANNTFVVKSIAAFEPQPDISVTAGCSAELHAPIAFNETSITWNDITGGGIYNKYLSFPNGKATAVVTPDENAPAYVDYEVCGTSVASPCSTLPYCDVVRVFFFPPPVVTIGPNPAIICPGGSGVELLGNVTGGDGAFDYIWTDGAGNEVGNALNYTATTVGTYTLEVRNTNYPNCQKFTASVDVVTNLTVNAGPDQLVCSQNPVQLAGAVTAATGGIWSGGSGTFSDRTALNAVYTPSAADISAGAVRLTLTSTGNGSCTAVTDEVLVSYYNMDVSLTGPNLNLICDGNLATITTTVTGAQGTVTYRWNTGETTAAISNKPAGTYTVTVLDENSCAIEKSITITQATGPTALEASLKASTCGNSNGEINITGVTGGTSGYTYSRNGSTFQSASTFTGLAAGDYTITVMDGNQCTFAQSFTLTNSAGPTAVAATSQPASCQNNDGRIDAGPVTDGTEPYTYSIDGSNFQTSTVFTGLAAGEYSLTAKDYNECTVSTQVTVGQNVPTSFTSITTSSTCGSNNGEITVTGVTGGTTSYTYSKDGTTFQNAPTFQNLLSGPYTITVKDTKGCTVSRQVQVRNIAGPTDLTTSIRATTCGASNGELTVTGVTGGTDSYTYSKDGVNFQTSATFTALAADTYTITVKDGNDCTYAEEVAVNNIAGPEFTATAKFSTCGNSNGSISISVAGGTAPYSYSKDRVNFQDGTNFTALAADDYIITVKDAKGCLSEKTVTISNIAGPTDFTLANTSATCGGNNGALEVTGVTGGTENYTYSINGGSFQSASTFGTLPVGNYTVTVKDANGCTISKSATINNVAGPTNLSASLTASTCGDSNGELTITGVTGGTENYSYSRDGVNFQASAIFTALAAGQHTITVKDANKCTFVKTFTIANIAGPTAVAATSLPATCANNDGTITAGTVTGGTAPYTYAINGSSFQSETAFAGVASGIYTLTAKDSKGCTVTRQVTVTESQPTNFTFTTTSTTCGNSNGEVTVTGVTGGKASYKYSKDGINFQDASSFTGLLAGTYTITVKDAKGCTYAKQVQVTNISGPTGFTAAAQSSTCGNRNGQVVASAVTGGTAPYAYSIDGTNFQDSGSFANLLAGTYAISVKDAKGCVYAKEVAVGNIAGPEFTAAAQSATCGNSNGTITISGVTGGTAPYTYSKDGVTFQDGTTFTALAAGDYTITVKDANDCLSEKTVTISNIAGPTDFTLANTSATCGGNNGKLEVTGVTGGTASYTYSINGGSFQSAAAFEALRAGNYTVRVKDANGCIISKSVTVNNVAGPTNLAASLTASTCGNSNGELTITSVTGGTGDYTYSKNGVNFQTSASFTALAAGQHAITVKDANGCTFVKSFTITNIAGPTAVAATSQPASCQNNDGTITAGTVTGGTASYTYSIDGSNFQTSKTFSAVAAGTYTLTAKDDNECTVSTQVTVGTNVPTRFTSTSTASTCGNSNGQFTITGVTGGTAPYTYSKDGGATFQDAATFTALAAGTYQVRVKDAKGCTYTSSVQVSNVAGPVFTATAQSSTCGNSNGRITISNVTGGTAPFSYSKDGTNFQDGTTFSGLAADTYRITVKDENGCQSTVSVELENIPGPTDFTVASASSSCGRSNGSITASAVAGGTAPYKYSIDGTNFQDAAAFTTVRAGNYTVTVKDYNGCIISKSVTVSDVAGPTNFTASLTASTCGSSNGELTITSVTGGTEDYTYSKDGVNFQASATFTALAAGQHAITVKDANRCTFVKSFTITNIAGPTAVAATSQPASCQNNNGTITAGTVTGGTAPYSYSINGSSFQSETAFAGVASGTYTLTVEDDNGCTVSTEVTVGQNIPTSFTSTTVSATCGGSDGRLTITGVTGGKAPYSYSIDGTNFQDAAIFTALAAGAHAITVKDDNGCTYTNQVQVNNLSGPSDLVASVRASTCGDPNGTITITSVSGGNASYTYSLDGENFQNGTSFAALAAGEYQVSVKDANGCVYTEEVVVTDIAAPAFTATAQASTCGNSNGSITISGITGGTAPFSFSKDGENFQTGNTFSGLAAGAYAITVKDYNGCQGTVAVELENIPGPTDFTLASTSSTCGGSNGSITASDVTGGTAPYTYSIDGTNFQDAAAFETVRAGDYTLTVKDANGCIISKSVSVSDIAGPTNLSASLTASTCGYSNGELTITGVTGGTEDYTYSKDGVNFQASATFTALAAGQHAITVKDANRCTFVKSFTITNIAGPTAVAATSLPATCADNDGTITAGTVTGGTAPYTYTINGSSFQSETAFAGVASGTYKLTAKDANGCTVSTEVTVGQNIPTSFTNITTASTCGESNGQFTITGVTGGTAPYSYSTDGSTFQSTATFTALAAGVYEVTVKDAKGCVFTDEVQLNNVAGPAFTATAQAATCGNSNGQVTASEVTGGTAPYTYSIDGETFQAAATFSNLDAGTYYITTQDAEGCSTTQSVEVEDITGPSEFELLATASTCGNSTGSITASAVTDGTAPYSYSINGTDFQAAATFEALAAGEYTVTVKDANGCFIEKVTVVENVNGPSDFTASTVSSFCGNPNGEVTVGDVTGGISPYTYSKDGATFQASATLTGLAAGNHTIVVKDDNGCTFSKSFIITNVAGPSALVATPQVATCAGNDGSITVGEVTGGTAPYAYSLDGVNYQSATIFTALTPQEYRLYVKDANDCSTSITVAVSSEALQEATLAATPTGCATSTGTITVTEVTGGTAPYAYSLNGSTYQAAALFENLAAGAYTITVKDAAGCVLSRTQDVVSTGGATSLTATTTNSSCGSADGSITISNVNGGRSPYTYSVGKSPYTFSSEETIFQEQAVFTNLTAGNYQIFVKDAAGCIYEQTTTINSNDELGNLQVNATPVGCDQNSGEVLVSGLTGGTAPYTYSLDGVNFQASATFTGVAAGQYELTVKDATNCSITTTVEVGTVSSTLAHVKDETCFGAADGEIAIAATGATDETEYSIDNGASYQKEAVFRNLPRGVYQVITRLSATCSITIGTVTVSGPAEIIATVTPLTKSLGLENTGSAAITKVEGGTKPYTYKVDNGSFTTATEFNNLSSGTHTLLVKDANGCTTEVTFTIEALDDIEFPNGFTPNGDGLNDKWAIKNLSKLYPRCRVTVYNRWGSLVFESMGYTKEWDGTYNGKKLPDGTYYSIIEFGDGRAPMKKSLTIMR